MRMVFQVAGGILLAALVVLGIVALGAWVPPGQGDATIPSAVPAAPPAVPTPAASAVDLVLARQLAPSCSGMTPDQIAALAVAVARQVGGTTPERILTVAVRSPDMVANVHTCDAAIRSAAVYDQMYGP